MSTTAAGLSTEEAERRSAAQGPNRLPKPPRPSRLVELLRQLTHLLALLLWVAAALALLAGLPELTIAIVVVVLLNAAFAFAQEYRADRSAERLDAMLPNRVLVRRDGRLRRIEAVDLVRGDVVVLAAGDRLAADLTLVSAHAMSIDESLVTGESRPVSRGVGSRVLAGTFVVQGEGLAEVAEIGADTTIAGISALTRQARRPPSPLTVQLNRVVRVVAVIAVATGTLLGVAGLALGLSGTSAFLFGVGVAVALVPEGLLPTVTLSLARGAQLMAERDALVRRLDAVETLGATTFVCTDKTGTLTQNRMAVVEVWTPEGVVTLDPEGYTPTGHHHGQAAAVGAMGAAAESAVRCVAGRVVRHGDTWVAVGDPMEAALHCWALGLHRVGVPLSGSTGTTTAPIASDTARTVSAGAVSTGSTSEVEAAAPGQVVLRRPFTSDRLLSSVVVDGVSHVLGAPESVLRRCPAVPRGTAAALEDMATRGQRVLAVARGCWDPSRPPEEAEADLELAGLVGLEDPPRPDVAGALEACREAAIRVAMVTGDHPATAAAIAREVGVLRPGGVVVDGSDLPADDAALGELLDTPDGAVVARVAPADKLRIARALRGRGHVVAMTGDGVNDAPALREADVGVAMGASGSDVAREAADLVLLDDHFATIVAAVELGRSTFANVRRFLTYHLADNVPELAPFAVWALTAGQLPLAIGVLQVLALDIGTDMLPAIGLGAEPPSKRAMQGPSRTGSIVTGDLLRRAFLVLGLLEATMSIAAFVLVLTMGGWSWGETPGVGLHATASGAAFAVIAVSQMGNAFACRSESVPVWHIPLRTNRLVLAAVAAEAVLLLVFLGVPWLSRLLGGSWPPVAGWAMAGASAVLLILLDAAHKHRRRRRR
jgi:magnesium-transporting ATPase (P-type)